MVTQLPREHRSDDNPWRPQIPGLIRDISPELYEFLQVQAETLRDIHNKTQAGDTTFSWEQLTYTETTPSYTLGSLGRFSHDTFGLIVARYVQFVQMNAELWSGSPVGFLQNEDTHSWRVTNVLSKSNSDKCVGLCASFITPVDDSYGWVIVSGVNIQVVYCDGAITIDQKVGWIASGQLGLSAVKIASAKVSDGIPDSSGVPLPIGSVFVDNLSSNEGVGESVDLSEITDRVTAVEHIVDGVATSTELADTQRILDGRLEATNRSLKIISERVAKNNINVIRAELNDELQLSSNYSVLSSVAATNAEAAALRSFGEATASNTFKRSAQIAADQAGVYAESATEMANTAALNSGDAGESAAAAAISAANAAVSETNAGVSATAASGSATSASTSAGTATTQAGVATTQAATATTQASNAATSAGAALASQTAAAGSAAGASTSAGNASTSAGQASTSATNAAGSATTARAAATIATSAATTATTQAANASTSASNASTSATAASGSASSAAGSAATASTQATLATSSANSAQSVANQLLPERPGIPANYIDAYSTTGTPESLPLMSFPYVIVNVAGEGNVLEYYASKIIATRGWLPVSTGRTFQVDHRLRLTLDVGTPHRACGFLLYSAAGAFLDSIADTDALITVANGWINQIAQTTSTAILVAQPTAAYVRAYGQINSANPYWQFAQLRLRDITSETAAAASAAAAFISATSAATSATSATGSAATATTQATNAATSASGAATFASAANTSATNASTSATGAASSATSATTSSNTATTQAANASTSASAASTSASSASTSSTAAGVSAASASQSATVAARIGNRSFLINPTFSDWPSGSYPTGWSDYVGGGGSSKVTGVVSANAVRLTTSTGAYASIYCPPAANPQLTYLRQNMWCEIELIITLVAGSLANLLLRVYEFDGAVAFQTAPVNDKPLSTCVDSTGSAVGIGTVGKTYHIVLPFKISDPDTIQIHMVLFSNLVASNQFDIHTFNINPASAAATVFMNATMDSGGNAIASWSATTIAGAASAAIRLESRAGGTSDSTIALEAQEIQLWDGTTRKLSMRVAGGNAQFMGDLNVGAALTVGSNKIAVALQSFQLTGGDGDSIAFGVDLQRVPNLLFNVQGLAAKTAAQVYDVQPLSLTSTGFTLRAKILTPGTTAVVTSSTGTNTGGSPLWQLDKSDAADAYNGNYTFNVTMTLDFEGDSPAFLGYAALEAFYRPNGGAWTSFGTKGKWYIKGSAGSQSQAVSFSFFDGSTIGQHATNTEFGITALSGVITAFGSVVYTKQSTSGVSSATPSGEKAIITVIPQNV